MAVEWKKTEARSGSIGGYSVQGCRGDSVALGLGDSFLTTREDIEALRDLCEWVLGGEVGSSGPDVRRAWWDGETLRIDGCCYPEHSPAHAAVATAWSDGDWFVYGKPPIGGTLLMGSCSGLESARAAAEAAVRESGMWPPFAVGEPPK